MIIQDDSLVHGLDPLNTESTPFSGRRILLLRLRNISPYPEPCIDPALHKVKGQIDSLYPTLGVIDEKDLMKTFGFLATIRDAFYDHKLSQTLEI